MPAPPPPAIDADSLAVDHIALALRWAARLCGLADAPHLVDEAESEAMVELVRASQAFVGKGGEGRFSTYLYARLRIMVLRLGGRDWRRAEPGGGRAIWEAVDTVPGPEDVVADDDESAAAVAWVASLPREQAWVIRHRFGLAWPRGKAKTEAEVARLRGRAKGGSGRAWVRRVEAGALARLREMAEAG